MRYLPEVDGLRAVAVLLVITTHMQSVMFDRLDGHLGVIIFFVLSGYLITALALVEESKYGVLSFSSFYIRRTFRIFPLYYFVLGLYCVLILGLHFAADKKGPLEALLPYYFFYFQEIPFIGRSAGQSLPFYQSWSLGIEEKFYLVWPVVCFLLLRYKTRLRIPAAVLLIAVVSFSRYTIPYIAILFGCVLALCLEIPSFKQLVERIGRVGLWASLCGLAVFQITVMPGWKWVFADSVYAAGFCIFLAFLLDRQNILTRILATQPLPFVGKISYGIYLIHVLCISVLRDKVHVHGTTLGFLLVCGISIAVATVLHYEIGRAHV